MNNRKILIILFTALMIHPIWAQWGVTGGFDLSSIGRENPKIIPAFHIGSVYDLKLSNKFYFQPRLMFSSFGFGFSPSYSLKKATVSMYGLEVPLLISFRPSLGTSTKLMVNAGPYAKYALFGKKHYEYSDNEIVTGSPFDAYNRTDIGFMLGIGLEHKQLQYGIDYQIGLNDAEKEISGGHRNFRISISYLFKTN